jgi:hypothetical protein
VLPTSLNNLVVEMARDEEAAHLEDTRRHAVSVEEGWRSSGKIPEAPRRNNSHLSLINIKNADAQNKQVPPPRLIHP